MRQGVLQLREKDLRRLRLRPLIQAQQVELAQPHGPADLVTFSVHTFKYNSVKTSGKI
jgi:hypothetical protein